MVTTVSFPGLGLEFELNRVAFSIGGFNAVSYTHLSAKLKTWSRCRPALGRWGREWQQFFALFSVYTPEAVLAGAGLTILRGILGLVLEVDEGGEVLVHLEYHIAALAAVTAIGAAGCHILLPVEMHRTIAALTGTDLDFTDIYKHLCCPSIGLWGAKNELPVKKPARFPGVYTENRAKNCCHSLPHLPRAGLHRLQVFSFADAN